ncbi:hypothetical protein [Halorussus sp. AFM4]|uniref:hypothetical protein n=1 Tax=Halorussus sp. AFM4 TaxID=3421651 RepID=UPI003EBF11A6
MDYIPVFLRPVSQMNTGLESYVEDKAKDVETITSSSDKLYFKQSEEVPVWQYKEALQGKPVIEHGKKVKVSKEVNHPERHWWIVTDGLLENLDPPLRDHADIFDLILAVNLCIEEPVAFSQSPGQTIGGTFQVRENALESRDDLSLGSMPLAILTMNEIPSQVRLSESPENIYEMVRDFRSTSVESDEDMDIRVGLHMYDDALTASLWTAMSNFFFVCENVLCSGRPAKPVPRITEVTEMSEEEAKNWKKAVLRLKHPDKGDVPSLYQQTDLKVPTLRYMRRTASMAIIQAMKNRHCDSNIES